MNALNVLKTACINKPFRSFKNLNVGDYVVLNFQRVNTNYGDRLRIELHDSVMYLPERFANLLTDEHLTELNDSTVVMAFSGKDHNAQNRLLLDFEIIREDENGDITTTSVINTVAPPIREEPVNIRQQRA